MTTQPSSSNFVTGQASGVLRLNVSLASSTQTIDVSGVTFLACNSNSTTASQRILQLTDGSVNGQFLTICNLSANADQTFNGGLFTVESGGNIALTDSADFVPSFTDTLFLQWIEDFGLWREVGRSNSSPETLELTNNHIFIGNGSNDPQDLPMTGDVHITNVGTGAQTAIQPGVVTNAKIAANTILNSNVYTNAAIAFSKLATATPAQFLVANGAGVMTAVTMSGDATMSNAGVVTIAGTALDIPSGEIIVGNASNIGVPVAMTGPIAIDNTGLTSIGSGVVTGTNIAATTVAAGNIVNNTITTNQISATAGIVPSQLVQSQTPGNVMVANSGGVFASVPVSGDATLSDTGVLTLTSTIPSVFEYIEVSFNSAAIVAMSSGSAQLLPAPVDGSAIVVQNIFWSFVASGNTFSYTPGVNPISLNIGYGNYGIPFSPGAMPTLAMFDISPVIVTDDSFWYYGQPSAYINVFTPAPNLIRANAVPNTTPVAGPQYQTGLPLRDGIYSLFNGSIIATIDTPLTSAGTSSAVLKIGLVYSRIPSMI